MRVRLHDAEQHAAAWSYRNGPTMLRLSLGIVFLWFGALKLFPGASPASALVARSVSWAVDPTWFVPLLALWECMIGIGLVLNRWPRLALVLLMAHAPGTFLPMVVCPELVWRTFPFVWTMEGQYILKNLVLLGAASALFENSASRPRERAALFSDVWTVRTPRTRMSRR